MRYALYFVFIPSLSRYILVHGFAPPFYFPLLIGSFGSQFFFFAPYSVWPFEPAAVAFIAGYFTRVCA